LYLILRMNFVTKNPILLIVSFIVKMVKSVINVKKITLAI